MNNQSKSLLPLVEILISTGIFAIAVILTLQLFMLAKFLGHKTSDTADAILKVQHIAETLKSFKSDGQINDFLENGTVTANTGKEDFYNIYYDINWEQIDNAEEAVYITDISIDRLGENTGGIYMYAIDLYKIEPYPFINDKNIKEDPNYKPLLASVSAGKFIANN